MSNKPLKGAALKAAQAKAEKAAYAELPEIVKATQAGGFMYTAPAIHEILITAGLVEINESMTDEHGGIATRATEQGITHKEQHAMSQQEQAVNLTASAFRLDNDVPVPTISGRGRGGNSYPFDAMAVGQSFFVANSEEKPNAAKSLASTVSSATARYAVPAEDGATKTNSKGEVVPVMVETRKFVVRSVEENGVKGARVWRTA